MIRWASAPSFGPRKARGTHFESVRPDFPDIWYAYGSGFFLGFTHSIRDTERPPLSLHAIYVRTHDAIFTVGYDMSKEESVRSMSTPFIVKLPHELTPLVREAESLGARVVAIPFVEWGLTREGRTVKGAGESSLLGAREWTDGVSYSPVWNKVYVKLGARNQCEGMCRAIQLVKDRSFILLYYCTTPLFLISLLGAFTAAGGFGAFFAGVFGTVTLALWFSVEERARQAVTLWKQEVQPRG